MRPLAFLALVGTTPLVAQTRAPLDVVDYHLSVDLPDTGKTISAHAELIVARRARADTLALDLLDLTVRRVWVAGRAGTFTQDARRVRIPLTPLAQPAGDTIRVAVEYGGAVTDGLIVSTDSMGRWLGFGDNWPNRARHWIPAVDHPSDKATVTWTVWAPNDRRVIANGLLSFERPMSSWTLPGGTPASPGPRTLTEWREPHPIATYLMVIAAAPLVRYDLGQTACAAAPPRGCVAQMVYTLPEQRRILPTGFAEADSIVTFFSRTFGPFPYEKLAHLQSSTRFGGMENASAIFYSDGAFRRGNVGYGLIAHETAHQWFGDAVTESDWPHLWLSEGFATYLAALYTQRSRGDSAFRADMSRIRQSVLGGAVVARRPVIDTIETTLMSLLNANSYQKGGFILHMLRTELGDSAFFGGVRAYVKRHLHGNATTDDLRAELEATSKRQLGAFFDQWLRRPGFPEVTASWTHDPAAGILSLSVEQSDRFGFFAFPLTVEYVDADGIVRRTRVDVPAVASSSFVLGRGIPAAPRAVRVDPDVALLARITMR
jgi:aminopeptidase N